MWMTALNELVCLPVWPRVEREELLVSLIFVFVEPYVAAVKGLWFTRGAYCSCCPRGIPAAAFVAFFFCFTSGNSETGNNSERGVVEPSGAS